MMDNRELIGTWTYKCFSDDLKEIIKVKLQNGPMRVILQNKVTKTVIIIQKVHNWNNIK